MKNTDVLLQPSPYEADEGALIGRDPRDVSAEDWDAAGAAYLVGLKAARANCLDCCCGIASEVRKCVCTTCKLWPLRMGAVPKGFRVHGEQQKPDNEAVSDAQGIFEGDDTGQAEKGENIASGEAAS